jgi:hypothetical protein
MDISTGNWFSYLREEVLTEGLRDIGLPEFVIDYLEDAMPDTSEKARMYIANNWKKSRGGMAGLATIPSLQYEVITFLMGDMFRNYVISNQPDQRERLDPVARVAPPFSTNDPTRKREAYDEERMEQNQKVAFVITNIRNALAKPQGTWRKAFMKAVKALSKAGLPSEKVESFKEYLRSLAGKNFHYWMNQYSELVDFLNADPTNYELIKDEYSIQDAHNKALEYLASQEDPEFIIHTFDDGSYWYNLNVSSCDVEASRMGHCGSDSRGVLVSLRKRQGKRRESSSYVTMTWSEYESTLYQIKGRSNEAPDEETWDHIAWFINNMDVREVTETGEHSNDYDGFEAMNEYLQRETNANFQGSIENRMERAEEYCEGVMERYADNRDELEYGDVGYNLEEEMNDVYCFASATYEVEINLGWPGYSATDNGFKPDEGDFKEIPREYGAMRQFVEDVGIDDMLYEMPGDDGDWDISLRNMVAAQPEDEEFNADAPATTHLVIRLNSFQNFTADEDGEVPEFDEFVDSMLEYEEDDAPAHIETIRQNLAAEGYMPKTAYDRSKEELMKLTDLDKWHVKEVRGGLEFDWTADDRQPLHPYTGAVKWDDMRAQMYGTGTGNIMGVNPDAVRRSLLGFGRKYNFANMQGTDEYTNQFTRELSRAITAHLKSKAKAPGQQELDFGDEYKGTDPIKVLADDTDFAVFTDVNYRPSGSRERFPVMAIKWLYRMRVGAKSAPGETEIIQEIARFLNDNPQLVQAAANKVISDIVEEDNKRTQRNIAVVTDNQNIQNAINKAKEIYGGVLDQYGDAEGYGSTAEIARRVYSIISWFEQNYADMHEAQRYVMSKKFLIPMARNTFRSTMDIADADEDGKPKMFDELVARQVEMMGGQPVKMVTRNESIEDQINRIDQMLNEVDPGYDLREYKVRLDIALQKDVGGEVKDTLTEIRGIQGVTTVRLIGDTEKIANSTVGTVEIKFELNGPISRERYNKRILTPGLMRIRGLKILRMGNIEGINANTLQEMMSMPFGGVVGQLGSVRYGTGPIRTPRSSVQQVADEWASDGVMGYDRPMANADMQYHVMVDTEELLPYLSRIYRNPKDAFDADYHHFIQNGPDGPVYVAVGKNGRIKITGNEDIVWFAKKSGLEQIPVFFSFQLQV